MVTPADIQALRDQRIPKHKQLNWDARKRRREGHTLFKDPTDPEGKRTLFTPWTDNQLNILMKVRKRGLVEFSRNNPRQNKIARWAYTRSLESGDPDDILYPELIRVDPLIS
jgi:hypothetical protein